MLRPLLATRIANVTPGVAFVVFGFLILGAPIPLLWQWSGTCAIVLLGMVWVVRAPRTRVRVGNTEVTVCGFLWSRTIPRGAIVDLKHFPIPGGTAPDLRWTSRSGRSRWTPLMMFGDAFGALDAFRKHNERCEQILRQELGLAGRVPAPRAAMRKRRA